MMHDLATKKELIHKRVVDGLSMAPSENEIKELVISNIDIHFPLISHTDKEELIIDLLHDLTGYGILEDLLADELVNEIMINSSSQAFIDRNGKIEEIDFSTSTTELTRLIQKIANACSARCDVSSPVLDAWLQDGSRVHGVLPPVAPDGPYLTIRKFISRSFELEQFCSDEVEVSEVKQLVSDSKNIVVAGGTSSGKTTLLNCLMHLIADDQRVISIEETAELHTDHPHWVRLLARSQNSEGAGAVTLGELVKASLRMRPDRIVVGEVRSAEAFDLVQALNTGHDGSLCTIHANGPFEVINRLASLAMFAHPGLNYDAIVSQICFGVDTIIFVKKANGKRQIESISSVIHENNSVYIENVRTGQRTHV